MAPSDAKFAQRTVAAAVQRRNPDSAKRDERNAYLAKQTDWKGTCQKCKETVRGTIAEISAHSCIESEVTP